MKLNKTDRSVSNMDVLKDIRGLLSVTQERENVKAVEVSNENSLEAEIIGLKTQIRNYEELVQKQNEELHKAENEKEALTAKLSALECGKDKIMPSCSTSMKPGEDTAQIEARIEELSSTLSKIDELTRLKSQELLRRIGRLFQESGQGEVAIEFRKAAGGLEVAENFAHFLRALLD
jgi:DNA repair exonuclease SbcCD ATPase subunit